MEPRDKLSAALSCAPVRQALVCPVYAGRSRNEVGHVTSRQTLCERGLRFGYDWRKYLNTNLIMSDAIAGPILRRGGDLFFNHLWDGRIFMVQVTRACLVDVFRSDGTADGDDAALLANLQRILAVAGVRVCQGARSPVRISEADF